MKLAKVIKKNRDPRWEEEFQFVLEEPPVNDRIHVEVVSTSKRMGLRHPKVHITITIYTIYKFKLSSFNIFYISFFTFRKLWVTWMCTSPML